MTMTDMAGWIAPVATIIAATMTAANLGARVTGWGFAVFTIGSLAWSAVGLASGQASLVATNIFLTLVNGIGIWRWLGRQASYEDGGKAAMKASQRTTDPSLFTATGIAGMSVNDISGRPLGKAVEALIECESGRINYVVVATGDAAGLHETLRAVSRERIRFASGTLTLALTRTAFEEIAMLPDGAWPGSMDCQSTPR